MIGNVILLILTIFAYCIEWKDISRLNTPEATISGSIKALLALIFGSIGMSLAIFNLVLLSK